MLYFSLKNIRGAAHKAGCGWEAGGQPAPVLRSIIRHSFLPSPAWPKSQGKHVGPASDLGAAREGLYANQKMGLVGPQTETELSVWNASVAGWGGGSFTCQSLTRRNTEIRGVLRPPCGEGSGAHLSCLSGDTVSAWALLRAWWVSRSQCPISARLYSQHPEYTSRNAHASHIHDEVTPARPRQVWDNSIL